MNYFKLSVIELVSNIYFSGDLIEEYFQNNTSSTKGIEAHQHIQNKYPISSEKEVKVSHKLVHNDITFDISGRIDGVHHGKNITIEEIKSTSEPLSSLRIDSRMHHLAQLLVYSYIYCIENKHDEVDIKLTYVSIKDLSKKEFPHTYKVEELNEFFIQALDEYLKFNLLIIEHKERMFQSIKEVELPFDSYRPNQENFINEVTNTILNRNILLAQAPTGTGKTISTLLGSIKGLQNNKQKIFYVTNAEAHRSVAENNMLLFKNNLEIKSITLKSKTKVCFMESVKCHPNYCPFAKGFFDRLKDATVYAFTNYNSINSNLVTKIAREYTICPFEFSLYLSYYCEVIICDYNYVFDPKYFLRRYFEEKNYEPILLVDEAHNLVNRSYEMYSTSISTEHLDKLLTVMKSYFSKSTTDIRSLIYIIDSRSEFITNEFYYEYNEPETLFKLFEKVKKELTLFLYENQSFKERDLVIDIFFLINDLIKMNELLNENRLYTYSFTEFGTQIKLSSTHTTDFLYNTIKEKTYGTVLFSATLTPLNFYNEILTKNNAIELEIKSFFPEKNLNISIDSTVSTYYKERHLYYELCASKINYFISNNLGNTIVFFPSYSYLYKVKEMLTTNKKTIVQRRNQSYEEKQEILNLFKDNTNICGLFIMGGTFSESIDFKGEMLKNICIVGVGLPQISKFNDSVLSIYDEKFGKGFDYVYTYPGITKVLQSMGRLIRSETDTGKILLIDSRYDTEKYLSVFKRIYPQIKNENN